MWGECVSNCAANSVYSPNNSSVVSDTGISDFEDLHPPNKTTHLKVGPYSNTTAECHFRGVMATGRVTCTNNGGYEHAHGCLYILFV